VSVIFNDGETGATLGTWNSPSIGAFTAPQFAVKDMEAAGGFSPTNHTRYTVQMSATFPGYFQHVLWNKNGISLTNVTGCGNGCRTTSCTSIACTRACSTTPAIQRCPGAQYRVQGRRCGDRDLRCRQRHQDRRHRHPRDRVQCHGRLPYERGRGGDQLLAVARNNFTSIWLQEGDSLAYMQHLVYNTRAGLITNMTAKCAFPLH